MTREPLVSVVIVAHNSWPNLDLAIGSALGQSYRSIEVIVVDNESSDRTEVEVADRFGARVRYVRQTNRGDGDGYNRGLAESRGELVQFLDGDDFLAPNKIERQAALLREEQAVDIAYGDIRQFQLRAGRPGWVDWDTGPVNDMLMALVRPDGNHAGIMVQSALFRRRVLEGVGPWDEGLYVVDYDYFLRAAWAGCRFAYCPGSIAFYQSRPGQMSADTLALLRGIASVWTKALTYVDREPYRSILKKRLAQRQLYLALADHKMTPLEARAALHAARELAPGAVPLKATTLAYLLLALPGGRGLMHVPWLAPLRAAMQRRFGLL